MHIIWKIVGCGGPVKGHGIIMIQAVVFDNIIRCRSSNYDIGCAI